MLTYGFFNAELGTNGKYDRVYSAEHFAEYFHLFIANGVFPDPATQLQVVASNTPDMNVNVKDGHGWINGYWAKNDGLFPIALQAASGTLNRIDAIVLRWVNSTRVMELAVKTGTPAASPTVPGLQRDVDIYELMLATVTVAAGATSITQSSITDKRPDSSVCGWVMNAVQDIDTTDLFAQYDTEFNEWFDNIKEQLSGNVATNLQNQIDQLSSSLNARIDTLDSATVKTANKATTAQAQSGSDDTKWMTPLKTKQAITQHAGFVNGKAYSSETEFSAPENSSVKALLYSKNIYNPIDYILNIKDSGRNTVLRCKTKDYSVAILTHSDGTNHIISTSNSAGTNQVVYSNQLTGLPTGQAYTFTGSRNSNYIYALPFTSGSGSKTIYRASATGSSFSSFTSVIFNNEYGGLSPYVNANTYLLMRDYSRNNGRIIAINVSSKSIITYPFPQNNLGNALLMAYNNYGAIIRLSQYNSSYGWLYHLNLSTGQWTKIYEGSYTQECAFWDPTYNIFSLLFHEENGSHYISEITDTGTIRLNKAVLTAPTNWNSKTSYEKHYIGFPKYVGTSGIWVVGTYANSNTGVVNLHIYNVGSRQATSINICSKCPLIYNFGNNFVILEGDPNKRTLVFNVAMSNTASPDRATWVLATFSNTGTLESIGYLENVFQAYLGQTDAAFYIYDIILYGGNALIARQGFYGKCNDVTYGVYPWYNLSSRQPLGCEV